MINADMYKNWKEAFDYLEIQYDNQLLIKYMKNREVVKVQADQFFQEVKRIATALQRRNLNGKHIGIIGKNSYEWFTSFCAVLYTGSVAVLLSKDCTTEEIDREIKRTDIDVIVYDHDLEEKMPWNNKVFWFDMDISERKECVSLKEEEGNEPIINNSVPEDLGMILFTSGTTGLSKAVMQTNYGLMKSYGSEFVEAEIEAQLVPMPFHHVMGHGFCLSAICSGLVLCIGEDVKYIYRYLKELKPDFVFVVPAVLNVIAKKLRKVDCAQALDWNLKVVASGGASFIREHFEIFDSKGIEVWQFYGASESNARGISAKTSRERLDSIGKKSMLVETKIDNGELAMRGPGVATEYYGDEKASKEVFRGGWYYTGDLFVKDEDDYYYLVGRKKNLIILSNGENISPEEIEGKLSSNGNISEILVGEENDFILAEVFPEYPQECTDVERQSIQNNIRENIFCYNKEVPTYKQIKKIKFREVPFEKTSSGKIIRH